jgi:hypothetical protein
MCCGRRVCGWFFPTGQQQSTQPQQDIIPRHKVWDGKIHQKKPADHKKKARMTELAKPAHKWGNQRIGHKTQPNGDGPAQLGPECDKIQWVWARLVMISAQNPKTKNPAKPEQQAFASLPT